MSRWYDGHTPDDETTITRDEWLRAQSAWPSPTPSAGEPQPPADPVAPATGRPGRNHLAILNQRDCLLCEGAGWVRVPDPFFGGATTDQRCPACQDGTVRAQKRRWISDDGRKSGPV